VSGRIYSGATPAEVRRDLAPLVDFRDDGMALGELETLCRERLLPHLMRYEAPEFQSMFNAVAEEGAAFGARLALEFNQGVTNWQVSPGGATLEEMCGRAVCRLFRLDPAAEATFMSAGTYANLQGLYLALHRKAEIHGFDFGRKGLKGFPDPGRLAVLASAEAHFSIRHAVRTLGLGDECVVTVPTDGNGRMSGEALAGTIGRISQTRDIACVVATAGTTSTGAVDPIAAIADLCSADGIWLHVDGAYGLAYRLVPEWAPLFEGVERADSLVWDPHKQLGVPIPNSLLFLRRGSDFGRVALHSPYFNRADDEAPNPGLKSPPSTRMFSALALAASILRQGKTGIVERLRSPLAAIRETAERLSGESDIELLHRPDTGILCFRLKPPGLAEEGLDILQQSVFDRIMSGGERTISLTEIRGRKALRLVAVSPAVTAGALLETISAVRRAAEIDAASEPRSGS
jgi:L-2,4-diaminobutyrate decarboxylase